MLFRSNQRRDSFRCWQREKIAIDRIGAVINFTRAMFGQGRHGIVRRRTEEDRFGFAGIGSLGEHFQRRRGYSVVANFRVDPNCVRHLDHLDFSKKVRDLLAAFAFICHRFAGGALGRPADGQDFFAGAFFTHLIGRQTEV